MNITKYLKTQKKINEANDSTYKLYDYMDDIINKAGNLKIGKWMLEIDSMSGTVSWVSSDSKWIVHATPFWEGAEGVAVDVQDYESGDYNSMGTHPLTITGNAKKDVATYVNIMKKLLAKVK